MDITAIQTLVHDIVGQKGPPRRPHRFWVPYAWTVRLLVEGGMNVSEACRTVTRFAEAGCQYTEKDLACLRVVYYKIREKEWPPYLKTQIELIAEEMGKPTLDLGIIPPDPEIPSGYPDDVEPAAEEPAAEEPADSENEGPEVVLPDPDADPDYQPEEFEV